MSDELAEARRLLAMAKSFDAGPLLGDVPTGWRHGYFGASDARHPVQVRKEFRRRRGLPALHGDYWIVRCGEFTLRSDGAWRDRDDEWDATNPPDAFDSPAAALAALEAWRAARRAEIAGQGGDGVARGAGEFD